MNYAGSVDRKEATSHRTHLRHTHRHFPHPGSSSITDASVFGEEGPGKEVRKDQTSLTLVDS